MPAEDREQLVFDGLLSELRKQKRYGRVTNEQLEWFVSLTSFQKDSLYKKVSENKELLNSE